MPPAAHTQVTGPQSALNPATCTYSEGRLFGGGRRPARGRTADDRRRRLIADSYEVALGRNGSSVRQRAISHPFFWLKTALTLRPFQVPATRAVASPPYCIVHSASLATGANGSFLSAASSTSRLHADRACGCDP